MGLEHILEIDLAVFASGLNGDNDGKKLDTLHGGCANFSGHIGGCPRPDEVDYSCILYKYILHSIHILYEHTVYTVNSMTTYKGMSK